MCSSVCFVGLAAPNKSLIDWLIKRNHQTKCTVAYWVIEMCCMSRHSPSDSARMSSIVLAGILWSLYKNPDVTKNATKCPASCHCSELTPWLNESVTIRCGDSLPDVGSEELLRQYDSLFSTNIVARHLTTLSVYNTPLTRVPASICQLLNLTRLHLYMNDNITELPVNCFSKLTKLNTLLLSHNSITGLRDTLFDGLRSLAILDLSCNQISFIGLRVFSNASDLISLRLLDLSNNKLTSLEPWWYYRCIQASPVKINLNNNSISNFTNKMELSFRCNMKRPYGHLDFRFNALIHIMDIFNGLNITDIDQLMCLFESHLTFSLAGFYYACDCIDFPIYNWTKMAPSIDLLDGVYCATEHFRGELERQVPAIAIPLNEFVCGWSARCPSNCLCVYRPGNSTLHVYCSSANLSSLPLDLPPPPTTYVKYKLDFSNNKLLRRLERRPYFVNTSIFDVSNCSLTEITLEDLKDVARFSVANFRGNMIQSLPRQADSVNISARLLLGLNPWKCSCHNRWMIEWLQSLSHQLSDPGDITCKSPARLEGRNVLTSTENDFCVDPVQHTLKITFSVVSAIVSVAIILIAVGLLMYNMRGKCYKRWKFHPFDRDECIGEDMDYDVFLSCSSLDHDPHGLCIVQQIESIGYRVCYHERDFLPGSLITDNIGHSVERSKRTVCLITNNFLQRYQRFDFITSSLT